MMIYINIDSLTSNGNYSITKGLWPWLFTHPFTKRFWNSVRRDGYLLTYTRGHKAVMNTHSIGGNTERVQ